MGSTLHHLQQWCSQTIQQAIGEFREEQDRFLRTSCDSLQAEQQRLARKHTEILGVTEQLVAQRHLAETDLGNRAAGLERRCCDLDAFVDELAREQAKHVRSLQDVRAEISRRDVPERLDALRQELATKLSKGVEQLLRDVDADAQASGQKFNAGLSELGLQLEEASAEIERLNWQIQVVQGQWTEQFRGHLREVVQHIQVFSGTLEVVYNCCLTFQDQLDRAQAEAALGQLVHAMNDIREYTGKYVKPVAQTSMLSTACPTPPHSAAGSGSGSFSGLGSLPPASAEIRSATLPRRPSSALASGEVHREPRSRTVTVMSASCTSENSNLPDGSADLRAAFSRGLAQQELATSGAGPAQEPVVPNAHGFGLSPRRR